LTVSIFQVESRVENSKAKTHVTFWKAAARQELGIFLTDLCPTFDITSPPDISQSSVASAAPNFV
jgi:hypothetical protein